MFLIANWNVPWPIISPKLKSMNCISSQWCLVNKIFLSPLIIFICQFSLKETDIENMCASFHAFKYSSIKWFRYNCARSRSAFPLVLEILEWVISFWLHWQLATPTMFEHVRWVLAWSSWQIYFGMATQRHIVLRWRHKVACIWWTTRMRKVLSMMNKMSKSYHLIFRRDDPWIR